MEIAAIVGIAGWVLALTQFYFNFKANREKNEAELLEKTLGYFERGTVARSMGISLVEGVWYSRRKYLKVIVPVLVSQIEFLTTEAESYAHERSNLIRLLSLTEKCVPYCNDPFKESIHVSEILISAAVTPRNIDLGRTALRHWFSKFTNGSTEQFDIETENS